MSDASQYRHCLDQVKRALGDLHSVAPPRFDVYREGCEDMRTCVDSFAAALLRNGHLILRSKHHGETHVKIVRLEGLV